MRLLVVDDAPDIANLLAVWLREEGYAVDTAPNGEQGLEYASINDYDVVLLDLNLPGIDGLEVCRQLRASQPSLLILMLTARREYEDRIAGLDLGADDYIAKPFDVREVAARLRVLLRRTRGTLNPLLCYADLTLDPAARTVWQGSQQLALTRKEFAILEYLLHHQGTVVSQEALLEHVWDDAANPFTNTVRVHINALRRKLGDTNAPTRYIETIVGVGYRLGPPPDPP